MMIAAAIPRAREEPSLLIEGYASVFGIADRTGDVVRAGAFARTLRGEIPPMLVQHQSGASGGRWVRVIEDGTGLFVRGLIETPTAAALIRSGLNGLSIGFRPRLWTPRVPTGRLLRDVELVEISLVAEPMLAEARFEIV